MFAASAPYLIVIAGVIAACVLGGPAVGAWLLRRRPQVASQVIEVDLSHISDEPLRAFTELRQVDDILRRRDVSSEERQRILEPILLRAFFGQPQAP